MLSRSPTSTPHRRLLHRAIFAVFLIACLGCSQPTDDIPPCRAPGISETRDEITLVPAFGDRFFEKPVQLVEHPTEDGTWFVALHRGEVLRVEGNSVRTVLDISDSVRLGEQWGLQQIALHPEYPRDDRVFLAFFATGQESRVAVVRSNLDTSPLTPPVEVLLSEAQKTDYHPIAGISFGPDGYLYIGWGEGGSKNITKKQLRTKLLRIDIDRRDDGLPYAIPTDNPFIGTGERPEAYALGLRNPWRFSFDDRGRLWLTDVGETSFEEINLVDPGRHYGWPAWEGTNCRIPDACGRRNVENPVYVHAHSEMCAAVGGDFYDGPIESLRGHYIYANGCYGAIWALDAEADPPTSRIVSNAVSHPASFTIARDGEMYLVSAWTVEQNPYRRSYEKGQILRIVPAETQTGGTTNEAARPKTLAELGCVGAGSPGDDIAARLVEYEIRHRAWDNGRATRRYMTARNKKTRIDYNDGPVFYPEDVVMKTYFDDDLPIETQMLARSSDGHWRTYLYEWNETGTDAVLAPEKGAACAACHNGTLGIFRALTFPQLDLEIDGRRQLVRMAESEFLAEKNIDMPLACVPKRPSNLDTCGATLAERARTYLDVNCASCHQPGGVSGNLGFDLRASTPFKLTGLCDVGARVAVSNSDDASLIAPGAPDRSVISLRMHATDYSAMPPGRTRKDDSGVELIDAWIASIENCR